MTTEERARLRELAAVAAGASSPRWTVDLTTRPDGTTQVYSPNLGPCRQIVAVAETCEPFAAAIVAAYNSVPALLDLVDASLAELCTEAERRRAAEARVVALVGDLSQYNRVRELEAALREARDWMRDVDAFGPVEGRPLVREMANRIDDLLRTPPPDGEGLKP